jgi:hypothetical protein
MALRQETILFPAKATATAWSEVKNVAYAGYTKYTCQINITGAPTAVRVKLYGSLDKVLWSYFLDYTLTAGELTATTAMIIPQTEPVVNFIKAELVTLTAGTSPTVAIYLKMSE